MSAAPDASPPAVRRPRRAVPPFAWLILALACYVGAVVSWQAQRLARMRPPPAAAATPAPADRAPPATAEPAPPAAPAAPPDAAAPPAAADASAPATAPDPRAGRQVLRCVDKGRVTYRDLNAGCPAGASERITVFPTEGVGRPR